MDFRDSEVRSIDTLFLVLRTVLRASVHTNPHSLGKEESIVHIDTPQISDNSASNHICCVIDTSRSMTKEATCKDENGLENQTGLSILDVI